MKRLIRSLFVVALATVTILPLFSATKYAQAQTESSPGVTICQNADAHVPMDVVLMLDKSGSIATADPRQERMAAVRTFVSTLERVSTDAERDVGINVVMFDTSASPLGWRSIASEADVEALMTDVEQLWNNRAVGGDTDQVSAFDVGFDLLASRGDRCRIVVMFTDGVMDTVDPGKNPDDLPRAQAEACTNTSLSGGDSLRERAEALGTNEFILLLNPDQARIPDFVDRLATTMTLFTSITGDTTPPTISEPSGSDVLFDRSSMRCTPKYPQTGEVLSASDATLLDAYFLQMGARVEGSEPGIPNCPQPLKKTTRGFPDGSLIREIRLIRYTPGLAQLDIGDFDIVLPNESVLDAADGFRRIDTGGSTDVQLVLEVSNAEVLPAGWGLTASQAARNDTFCVELFSHTGLTAAINSDGTIRVSDAGQRETLQTTFAPDITGVVFKIEIDGDVLQSTDGTFEIPLTPGVTPSVAGLGTVSALGTEMFQDLPVVVSSNILLENFSPEMLPTASCEPDLVTFNGEVPESSSLTKDTVCVVEAGAASDGLKSFVRVRRVDGDEALPGRMSVQLSGIEGLSLGDGWTEFVGKGALNVEIASIPNQLIHQTQEYAIDVAYGHDADDLVEGANAALNLQFAINARSNSTLATLITVVAAVFAALLSMLLLWIFNRLTARLPKPSEFYWYTEPDLGEHSGFNVQVNGDHLQPVRGKGMMLAAGPVEVKLKHPPVWRPFSESIGVISAPGPAVADPTGPSPATIPVAFSDLVIAYRDVDDAVRYVLVVPRRGPKSGIDAVELIMGDSIRLDRVSRRIVDNERSIPETSTEVSGPDLPGFGYQSAQDTNPGQLPPGPGSLPGGPTSGPTLPG